MIQVILLLQLAFLEKFAEVLLSGASPVKLVAPSPVSSQRQKTDKKKGIENEEEFSRLHDAVGNVFSRHLCGNFFDGPSKIETGSSV